MSALPLQSSWTLNKHIRTQLQVKWPKSCYFGSVSVETREIKRFADKYCSGLWGWWYGEIQYSISPCQPFILVGLTCRCVFTNINFCLVYRKLSSVGVANSQWGWLKYVESLLVVFAPSFLNVWLPKGSSVMGDCLLLHKQFLWVLEWQMCAFMLPESAHFEGYFEQIGVRLCILHTLQLIYLRA